ncbi:MAG: GNAT family N-acetyltransferase [Acetobacteraceae bacterium]
MPDGSPTFTLTLHNRIADIAQAEWDSCAGDANPFVSHAFLAVLEESGSATARTGWLPQHAVLRDNASRIAGVAPMYAKGHSYGEYVFDHGWAHAFERAGGAYYPKLQVAVPFSPVPGPRLLMRPSAGETSPSVPAVAMAAALEEACRGLELSSVHVTFCEQPEWSALGAAGWLQRTGMQFHWQNAGYRTFEDFLSALSSRKRKMIRRERREAASGLTLRVLSGSEIEPRHWAAFYKFYTATVDRKWGSAYLTQRFFPLLAERLGDRVVLMLAEQDGKPVAGALNLVGSDTLFGRNWGCRGEWPFLHFELCYYQAIEFAIAHGLQRVEAGAQGQHKLQRGYLPTPTFSAHWIAHPGLRHAVADFLRHERTEITADMAVLAEHSPFRAD